MRVNIKNTALEYDGVVRIEKASLQYERFDGGMSDEVTRFHYGRGDAVAVLVYDERGRRVLLIRQFRYPVYVKTGDGWLTECIAGMMEENESPLDVAFREVFEETGLKLKSAELLAHYFFSPGGCSDKVHLYVGEVEDPGQPIGIRGLSEEGEDIQAVWVPLAEALAMVDQGMIHDAKTLIGLSLLSRRLGTSGRRGNG